MRPIVLLHVMRKGISARKPVTEIIRVAKTSCIFLGTFQAFADIHATSLVAYPPRRVDANHKKYEVRAMVSVGSQSTGAMVSGSGETRSFPQAGEHYAPLINQTKEGHVHSHALQTVLADQEALYALWKDIPSIPLWQEHVVSCTPVSETVSHWVMGNPDDPKGKRIEFDSQITEDVPGRRLAWQSITDGVDQAGSVTFAPHPTGRGTTVLLQQVIKMPGGFLGNVVASVAERGPKQTVIENLRHFKEMAEAGEIPSVTGQPHGPRGISGDTKKGMYGETNPKPPGTSESA